MSRHWAAVIAFICACVLALTLTHPTQAADDEASGTEASDEAEDSGLRQRLTEREDKARSAKPWSIDIAGRPLTVSGAYELDLGYLSRRIGNSAGRSDRWRLEQELEAETFYSFGSPLALFAQLRAGASNDLHKHTPERNSDSFLERGEMWLYSENLLDTCLNIDLGRLHFEDDRRWWWNENLDAVRVAYDTSTFEIAIAIARELAPDRLDHDFVDPEQDRVRRLIAEASWDFSANHALQFFLLHQNDRSTTEQLGEIVRSEREDESDAQLTWVGARLIGVFDRGAGGLLGYWFDGARVHGAEWRLEFEPLSPSLSILDSRARRDVRGWAVDAGINAMPALPWEPRLYAGYAFGSGDAHAEDGADRSFRQTGIHANEAGFGGVQRFAHYGVALDPELSNLGITTLGAGRSLLKSSSLDIVYHHYRLIEPATSLRDARLAATLTGAHRDLGSGIDVVLAFEEREGVQLEFIVSGFRAGRAFGNDAGTWSYAGSVILEIGF